MRLKEENRHQLRFQQLAGILAATPSPLAVKTKMLHYA